METKDSESRHDPLATSTEIEAEVNENAITKERLRALLEAAINGTSNGDDDFLMQNRQRSCDGETPPMTI